MSSTKFALVDWEGISVLVLVCSCTESSERRNEWSVEMGAISVPDMT